MVPLKYHTSFTRIIHLYFPIWVGQHDNIIMNPAYCLSLFLHCIREEILLLSEPIRGVTLIPTQLCPLATHASLPVTCLCSWLLKKKPLSMTFVIFLLVCCPCCMLLLFYWNNVYVVGLPYKKERGDIVESLGRGGVSCELSIHRLLLRLIVSTGIGKRTKHLHWMTEKYIIIYSVMHSCMEN